MLIHPVKASEWQKIGQNNKELLKSVGALPVNDVFFPCWNTRHKIELYYGSYGSGKSVFICQDLINKCLHDPYFKCFYGRKKWVDVRESCFDTLVSTIEEIGLQQYFRYSRADNSSMVVKCVNGNVFNPFGGSEPDSMKSIKDPSHIWCEEFDQFEDQSEERQGDFQLLFPRLRTTKAPTQFIASFNTAPVFPTHWIMKYFFPHLYEGEDKPEFDFLKGIDTHYQFANFTDNYFIDQEEYDLKLRMSSGGNTRLYEAIAKGHWGVVDNKQPWLYNFDYHKHVRPVKLIPGFPIYCAFDFNVSPFACTIWQFSPNMGIKNSFIHCIDEIVGQNKIEATCDIIKSRYPSSIIFVNGDRSGQNEDLGRNQTLYQMIAARLNINPAKQLILHTQNLEHVDSWALMNAMFWHYPNLYINDTCREFIKDCQKAKSDPKSNKPYQLLKNREDYKMDAFDSGRYFFQDYFLEFAQKTYLNVMNKR